MPSRRASGRAVETPVQAMGLADALDHRVLAGRLVAVSSSRPESESEAVRAGHQLARTSPNPRAPRHETEHLASSGSVRRVRCQGAPGPSGEFEALQMDLAQTATHWKAMTALCRTTEIADLAGLPESKSHPALEVATGTGNFALLCP